VICCCFLGGLQSDLVWIVFLEGMDSNRVGVIRRTVFAHTRALSAWLN
jgi:hypothetical protein